METRGIQDWFRRRLEIADGLAKDPTAVFDAEILLCCAMSALAATAWPGERKDHKRYIEFLVHFVRSEPDMRLISVPVLAQRLEQDPSYFRGGRSLRDRFFPELGRIYDYREVDKTEAEILTVLPSPPPPIATIRESSYASIIYSDLRSGLVHEYALSNDLADFPLSID